MKGENKSRMLPIVLLFLSVLFIDAILIGSHTFSQNASAVERKFEETITIEPDKFRFLELSFSEGNEMEFIFHVEVNQGLPVDLWFVNSANYDRLEAALDFLYFIDGSQKNVTKATKIVTVTQHDIYYLVFVNYNNATVDVYLTYNINIYPEEEKTKDFWKEPYIMFPMGLIIGIVTVVLAFRVKGRSKKGKKQISKVEKKVPSKKVKKVKTRAKKVVSEEAEPMGTEEAQKIEEKAPTKFCGHCGKPVETPFCPYCGKEVLK